MADIEKHSYIKSCVDSMLAIESLSDKDRKDLDAIKKLFDKPASTRDQELLSTKNILTTLENKIDQMHDIDKKKVLDVKKVMQDHNSDLASLKADIQDPTKKLDEYKKKTFDTIKEDLEKHWWSSWLAGPVYGYLIEKYIDKKPVSPVKDWIAKHLGIPLVGLFLPSALTNVLEKMDTLTLPDVSALEGKVENGVKTIANASVEEVNQIKQSIAPAFRKAFEKLVGHPIEPTAFSGILSDWMKKRGSDLAVKNKANGAAISSGTLDPMAIIGEYLVVGPKAMLDLIARLADKKVISWNDVALESVERSGKSVLRMGFGSFGLFSRYLDCIFGELSVEDLTDYVKKDVSGITLDSKAAIWGMLYRHGGWFRNLMGKIGDLTGHMTSFLFGSKGGADVTKFAAYWESGVGGKVSKEIALVSELEKSLVSTGMFAGQNYRNTGPILSDIVSTLKKNTQIFACAQEAKTMPQLLASLKSFGITKIDNVALDAFAGNFDSLAKFKTALGHSCATEMTAHLNDAGKSFGLVKKMLSKVMPNAPWAKYPLENEMIEMLKAHSATQEKLLKNENLLQKVKSFFTKFEHGQNLSNMVEYGDKVKFHLKTVTEAKEFFDNVAMIGKSSPEIFRTLFKGFPLIMVGKDVLDTVFSNDPAKKDQSLLKTMATAMGYITPVVGPIMLIHDSVLINDWKVKDLAGAGIGAGMLAYDTVYAVKAFAAKGFWKYMTSPIRDAVSFTKSVGQGAYTAFKMTRDLALVAKTEGLGALGREGLIYLRKIGIKTAVIAALVLLGYFTWKEFFEGMSEEEKKMFVDLEKKGPAERERWIAQQWKTMEDDQKILFLKVATAQRLGFQDPEFVDVKKSGTNYTILVKQLTTVSQLTLAKLELQQAVDAAEGAAGKTVINYTLDGGSLEAALEQMTKDGRTKDEIKAYLLELGYSVQDVDQMIKKA